MLSTEIKKDIQTAYSRFLKSKGYAPRRNQRAMIAEIAKVLANADDMSDRGALTLAPVAVIEAATGIGKTISYLLAALPVAQARDKKIVISTATIALQEQILLKDLPDLRKHSGLVFEFALAKGRGRYVCTSKLVNFLENETHPQQSLAFGGGSSITRDHAVMQRYRALKEAYFADEWTGDRDSWPEAISDYEWYPLTATHFECAGRRCQFVDHCPFFNARKAIQSVDCIIANHDLVLSDLALGGGVVLPPPEESIYIFDEGHHLAEKALDHFSYKLRLLQSEQWLQQFILEVPHCVQQLKLAEDGQSLLEKIVESAQSIRELFSYVNPLCQQILGQKEQFRFEHGEIAPALKHLAHEFVPPLQRLTQTIETLIALLKKHSEEKESAGLLAKYEHWQFVLGFSLRRSQLFLQLWTGYMQDDAATQVPHARWLDQLMVAGSHDIELHYSPVLAADVLLAYLWRKCFAAVMTSATLSLGGDFGRFKMQTGLGAESHYVCFESPFDYLHAAQLVIPPQAVDPTDESKHLRAIVDYIHQCVKLDEGVLVLFNSQRQMDEVYAHLSSVFQDITLVQGMQSKQSIIKEHKNKIECGEGSIIFGLASFSEGVDLPGKYLEHVIIARIPFAVPSDPVSATLYEWLEKQGKNSFDQVSIPDATMRLVQACGRLLRNEDDRGKVVMLDRRIITKPYGKKILRGLPPFQLVVQPPEL